VLLTPRQLALKREKTVNSSAARRELGLLLGAAAAELAASEPLAARAGFAARQAAEKVCPAEPCWRLRHAQRSLRVSCLRSLGLPRISGAAVLVVLAAGCVIHFLCYEADGCRCRCRC
jgi:hypothetical protein